MTQSGGYEKSITECALTSSIKGGRNTGIVNLSKRLYTIASLVTPGNRLVDVGCDHGFLSIWLVQRGIVPSAIASDVRPGPLSRAETHVRENGLQDKIETRLSDGLKAIRPGEGDTLVIAGMGSALMERILTEGKEVRESFRELILQPQSDIPHFRKYLLDEGLTITDERIVEEDGKFYPMMKALIKYDSRPDLSVVCKEEPRQKDDVIQEAFQTHRKLLEPELNTLTPSPWTEVEIQYGRYLLKSHDPVMERYLAREKNILTNILKQLESETGDRVLQRKLEVEEQLKMLAEAGELYERI